MAKQSEPRGSKPFLPGLLKMSLNMVTNITPVAKASCVMHARWNDLINHPITDLINLGAYWVGQWDGGVMQQLSSSWQMQSYTLQSLGGDGFIVENLDSGAGGVAGGSCPPGVAICVSLRSGITQRGGRGRIYLPGLPLSVLTTFGSPAITAAAAANFSAHMMSLITAVNAHTVSGIAATVGIPSYYSKYTIRPIPFFYPVLSTLTSERVDSQRRRNGKESAFAHA